MVDKPRCLGHIIADFLCGDVDVLRLRVRSSHTFQTCTDDVETAPNKQSQSEISGTYLTVF